MDLSTADLEVGGGVDVVVNSDTTVPAVVLWANAEQFVARSPMGVHRGWVAERLGGGPAFCEGYRSDLGDEGRVLAWVREHLETKAVA